MGLTHLIAANILWCVRILFWEPQFGYLGSKSLVEQTSFYASNMKDPLVIYQQCFNKLQQISNETADSINIWESHLSHVITFMIHYR